MPSEIDDIFSGKAAKPSASTPTPPSNTKKSKKRKPHPSSSSSSLTSSTAPAPSTSAELDRTAKKQKRLPSSAPSIATKPKREPVQVTVDPSSVVEAPRTSTKDRARASQSRQKQGKNEGYDAEKQKELEEFMDSRGSGRKRTDDGLLIYSEAELRIGQGGDTPLCPFDCDCCF